MSTGATLTLRSREAADWQSGERGIIVTVADNGLGLTSGTLARLFKPFTTKGPTGTGLGLWVTVFTLFLPFEPPSASRSYAIPTSSISRITSSVSESTAFPTAFSNRCCSRSNTLITRIAALFPCGFSVSR